MPRCLTANLSVTRISVASATPWPSTWRGGRESWCGAANRAPACRSRCRWWRRHGAKISPCVWRCGWRKPSAAGSRPRYLPQRAEPVILVDEHALIGGHILELLFGAAGPHHFQVGGRMRAQSEGKGQIALRAVAGAAAHHVPLFAACAFHPNHRADPIAIRFRTCQTNAQPMVAVAAVIAQKNRRSVVGGDQDVQIAVVVEIGIGRAARHYGFGKCGSYLGTDVVKTVIPQIAE